MQRPLFLITPPFTQLNTPYPATAYLKGFLNTKNIPSVQADLGIEVVLSLFSQSGLRELFDFIGKTTTVFSDNATRILALRDDYISTIGPVMLFLQGKNPTLALRICQEDYLPEASRFYQLAQTDWAFGTMGTQDKAKHFATLYLEDLSDLIVECADPYFGFSRYAERLGRSAHSFDELYEALAQEPSFIDNITLRILAAKIAATPPALFLVTVPFPGNLYSAFRCAQWLKRHHPEIKTAMGGGFPNTELRSLSDARVFEFFDFITLDDGELPVELLHERVSGQGGGALKRTFLLEDGKVIFKNDALRHDYKQAQTGTPDYDGLPLDHYVSVLEVINPMHRLWSDGRWNKLTMAHGCYWGKCTFCDISLDYIKIYEPVAATLLCDRMEEMITQTGQNGFHFVDEAAPPALMRALALEILKRKLAVSWWTNIRFEKSFTRDLCQLLKASGCIAVSGGLEVASDRLLQLIDKGVTVGQVAAVTRNFTQNGIMVHAYLMYGYPTQTVQETIDSLEMVRQMFDAGILQSGFWHQFAMTAHSPVGLHPEQFNVRRKSEATATFANNDLEYIDPTGIDHEQFSFGLKKSLYNFMHGNCFDYELQQWFDFRIPKTKIPPDFIEKALSEVPNLHVKSTAKITWLGGVPVALAFTKTKKGASWPMLVLEFHSRRAAFAIQLGKSEGNWLLGILPEISASKGAVKTYAQLKTDFERDGRENFELFWFSKAVVKLRENGLLVL